MTTMHNRQRWAAVPDFADTIPTEPAPLYRPAANAPVIWDEDYTRDDLAAASGIVRAAAWGLAIWVVGAIALAAVIN